MLPTIIENENLNSARESSSPNPNPKSPKKSNSSTHNGGNVYARLAQNRPDISTEGSKSAQAHKRGTSSSVNPHFYANIRQAMQPEPKATRSQRASDVSKDTSLVVERKVNDEESEKPSKGTKLQLGDEHMGEPLTKSQTDDRKQTGTQNPRSARDALKAKFKDREYNSGSCSPMAANNYKGSNNLAVKTNTNTHEATLNRLAAKYLGSSKSPNNLQLQQSVRQKASSDTKLAKKPATGEKNLLQANPKPSQKDLGVHQASSNDNRARELALSDEGLVSVLKKGSNLTPVNREKGVQQNSAIKLSMHRSEVLGSGKGERRDPSPHVQQKKVQRDMVSISPTKNQKGQQSVSKNKEQRESKPQANSTSAAEVRKSTPVQVFLSEEEKAQYGNRTLPDYEKLELLGKGGFALVWLGECKNTGRKVAIKQMAKKSIGGNDSKKADQYYGQLLFKEGGEPREEFVKYPGISHIACFIDYKSTKFDDWHISELCGKTLSSLLFDMKGEFCKGERVYAVKHLDLHRQFKNDGHTFKAFIKSMAEAMDLFSNYYIVHCDIKPENILIDMNANRDRAKPFQLKIIDFGSAYNWGDTGKVRMATPEYMPPEFLNALIPQNGTESTIEQLAEISKPWSVDVWSLGAVMLEVITGIPLWIPLKCKLDNGSKSSLKFGLFAVKARAYDKIYLKQRALVENLGASLSEYLNSWPDADNLFDLLQNMLKWDPKKRISPAGILQHPYLNGV